MYKIRRIISIILNRDSNDEIYQIYKFYLKWQKFRIQSQNPRGRKIIVNS